MEEGGRFPPPPFFCPGRETTVDECRSALMPPPPPLSRRSFLRLSAALGAASVTSGATAACFLDSTEPESGDGRLSARPGTPAGTAEPGVRGLNLGGARDGVLFVPETYQPSFPIPLMVLFHGAGGLGAQILQRFQPAAEEAGVAILAPDARGATWDVVYGGFGPDAAFVDRALKDVFGRLLVDPGRIAAAGFSDGGSYALSLGLVNGDLFTRVLGFSPGFIFQGQPHGKPPVYIAHGVNDGVLPIAQTSRRLVPELQALGYEVHYHEFDGGHAVPPAIAQEGVAWMVG